MSSHGKLRRAPLFGNDGHLGIPLVVSNNKNIIQVRSCNRLKLLCLLLILCSSILSFCLITYIHIPLLLFSVPCLSFHLSIHALLTCTCMTTNVHTFRSDEPLTVVHPNFKDGLKYPVDLSQIQFTHRRFYSK